MIVAASISLHGYEALVIPGGQQRRFVQEVFQVRARETWRALGDAAQVHVVAEDLATGVYPEDRLSAFNIGQADINLAVKTAGTQKRTVQYIRAVCGRHHNNAFVCCKAVHLNKKLVERLLALVMPAAEASAALTADCIDFVDER